MAGGVDFFKTKPPSERSCASGFQRTTYFRMCRWCSRVNDRLWWWWAWAAPPITDPLHLGGRMSFTPYLLDKSRKWAYLRGKIRRVHVPRRSRAELEMEGIAAGIGNVL